MSIKLLDGVTANATGSSSPLLNGPVGLFVSGGYGSGTLTIQACHPTDAVATAGNWATILTLVSTDTQRQVIYFPGQYYLRAVLAGSTNPTLTVQLN